MRNSINEVITLQTRREERILLFERRCRERGLPVTVQRRSIFEALLDSDLHPTAEQLFRAVQKSLPHLSLATVYRGIMVLVDLGLVKKICSPGSQCRYDGKIHRHHHLVCLFCDEMVDLEDASLNELSLPDRRETGFDLVDYSIQFRGTCPDCLKKRQGREAETPQTRC